MLLVLPRELRNPIIDQVLLTPEPKPVAQNAYDAEIAERSPFPIPPLRCNLLAVCTQLRSETTERAPKLDIPFVLDILSLSNGSLQYTWLNRPRAAPSEWGRVPLMEVQLRIQPIR